MTGLEGATLQRLQNFVDSGQFTFATVVKSCLHCDSVHKKICFTKNPKRKFPQTVWIQVCGYDVCSLHEDSGTCKHFQRYFRRQNLKPPSHQTIRLNYFRRQNLKPQSHQTIRLNYFRRQNLKPRSHLSIRFNSTPLNCSAESDRLIWSRLPSRFNSTRSLKQFFTFWTSSGFVQFSWIGS
jgi:hypothetical protein